MPQSSTGQPLILTDETDDTHLLGTDLVNKPGYVMSITVLKTGAGGGTIHIYDTNLATAAASMASEEVMFGPITVKTGDPPVHINLHGCALPFSQGVGVAMSAGDLGVQIMWTS